MNDATPASAGAQDWLDAALRDGRDGYIDDAGFTARMMRCLPAPAVQLPAWRTPAVFLLWGLALVFGAQALPNLLHDVTRDAYRLYTAQPLSLPMIITLLATVAVTMWGAAAYTLRVR